MLTVNMIRVRNTSRVSGFPEADPGDSDMINGAIPLCIHTMAVLLESGKK